MSDKADEILERAIAYRDSANPDCADRIIIGISDDGLYEITFVSPDGIASTSKVYEGKNILDEMKIDIEAFI